jgi:hypothetical protein
MQKTLIFMNSAIAFVQDQFDYFRCKMKLMHRLFLLALLVFYFSPDIKAQDPSESERISTYFELGNASGLSKYFKDNIDITLNDESKVYTRAQAEKMLQSFFASNKPSGFRVMHRGKSKTGLEYVIANLESGEELFRVSYYFRITDGKLLIQQLMITSSE